MTGEAEREPRRPGPLPDPAVMSSVRVRIVAALWRLGGSDGRAVPLAEVVQTVAATGVSARAVEAHVAEFVRLRLLRIPGPGLVAFPAPKPPGRKPTENPPTGPA